MVPNVAATTKSTVLHNPRLKYLPQTMNYTFKLVLYKFNVNQILLNRK